MQARLTACLPPTWLAASKAPVGTLFYMSPETLRLAGRQEGEARPQLSSKMDVWSLGVCLFELVAGAPASCASLPACLLCAAPTPPPPATSLLLCTPPPPALGTPPPPPETSPTLPAGYKPFQGVSYPGVTAAILSNARAPLPAGTSPEFEALVEAMLAPDPQQRPGAQVCVWGGGEWCGMLKAAGWAPTADC